MLDDLFTPTNLIFVLVLALLILGPRRLPEFGSSLGRSIRNFRQAFNTPESEAPARPTQSPAPSEEDHL